jgi:hypothetical protein
MWPAVKFQDRLLVKMMGSKTIFHFITDVMQVRGQFIKVVRCKSP